MADIIVYEKDEEQLYQEVRDILVNARDRAYNNSNKIMTYAYWNVGRRIVEQEQNLISFIRLWWPYSARPRRKRWLLSCMTLWRIMA